MKVVAGEFEELFKAKKVVKKVAGEEKAVEKAEEVHLVQLIGGKRRQQIEIILTRLRLSYHILSEAVMKCD